MKKFFTTTALLCCFMVCFAVMADIAGKWSGTIVTPDGQDIPVSYNFKVDGEKLTGTADSPQGSVSIDDGKITGDQFSFKVSVSGNDYPHTGKVYADSLAMDLDFGGQKVHFIVKKDK
ncbi:glycoside hydrolase [Mucilaginibacter xinganensis]|uniref:Glycoside hydrolase n=1 Tax=Mucilaginibacter xinganensis TaxID=1234841 RepID=A0A223NTB7_9SPHI|nr:glycoside hydrolase [Mucilaginibacter xinganensis]ASU32888.1 glycoside hydrolase [Mucilaginibacter xinganensis]